MDIDKSWMGLDTARDEYLAGVDKFLDYAFSMTSNPRIPCPCVKCKNFLYQTRDEVRIHLVVKGILKNYVEWIYHGETYIPRGQVNQPNVATSESSEFGGDDMHGLIEDAIGPLPSDPLQEDGEEFNDEPNKAARKFYDLLKDAETELYPGCNSLSKLSFVVKLLHIKCLTRMTTKAVTMILDLFKAALPEGADVPKNYYAATKVVRSLGLTYKKIDACPNDCMLYWKEKSDLQCCPVCNVSRWKSKVATATHDGVRSVRKRKKVARKILRYFPIKERLQRLFMSKKTASSMRWHHEDRVDDGIMRHPADSPAWKKFDEQHPVFATEPRNVRLGLAADGMSPYGYRTSNHSTWPVILVPYNLPPWMCMKSSYFMLSMIVPGPRAPGKDLDVYMQPLIDELKELWDIGIDTYDASKKQNFRLHASLLWTINDFPGYADLSGWSTKGRLACPTCHEHTSSVWLNHGQKWCYPGNRRFLPSNHCWRKQKKEWNGKNETRDAPPTLSGEEIYEKMCHFADVTAGKSRKRKSPELPGNWKHKSIFFELPYWKNLLVRHNLDVMHIEKNVCDAVLNTLMGFSGSKDNLKARFDLQEWGIRTELHPVKIGDKYALPAASYTLSRAEKQTLCDSWKRIKVSDGFSSNIANCVKPAERNITNLKSHDCHVIFQHFLPMTIRSMLTEESVRDAIIELCMFFKEICSKTLINEDLERLERQIVVTLCKLERIFPPGFFVVMMHLPIHLANEAILAGPVQYRWMYPFERYLGMLKDMVGNLAHPEGSIAEAYLVQECITFCSLYLDGIETRHNRLDRNEEDNQFQRENVDLPIFINNGSGIGNPQSGCLSLEEWHQARLFVLQNCDCKEVDQFAEEHYEELFSKFPTLSEAQKVAKHNKEFPEWFCDRMEILKESGSSRYSDDLWSLARGPYQDVARYSGHKINGYRFHTRAVEERRTTQNSGVLVKGVGLTDGIDFYGVLIDVVELLYPGRRRVALFKCEWRDVNNLGLGYKKDKYGFVSVNSKRSIYGNEPFVLASQAKQIFFVEEVRDPSWHIVVVTQPRSIYDVPERILDEENIEEDAYQEERPIGFVAYQGNNDDVVWSRDDVQTIQVDAREEEEAQQRRRPSNIVDEEGLERIIDNEEDDDMVVSDKENDMIVSDEEADMIDSEED